MNTSTSIGGADKLRIKRTMHNADGILPVYTVAIGKGLDEISVHFVPTPELLPLIESLYQLANFPAADVLPNGTSDPLACEDCGVAHE